VAGATFDVDFAAKQGNALSHAGETEAHPRATLPGIETGAVVLHGKFQAPAQAPQRNLYLACSGVACNVAQSLLRDAKEAQRHFLRKCIGNVPGVHLQSNWTPREALALGFQRFDQSEVFADGEMEAIRRACTSSLSRTNPSRIDPMAAPPVGPELRSA